MDNPRTWMKSDQWTFGVMTMKIERFFLLGFALAFGLAIQGCDSESATAAPSAPAATGTFTDARDGQMYKYVTIGTQVWMAQNLNFEAKGSWWAKNSADSGAKYGRLYRWSTAMGLNDSCDTTECASQVAVKHQGSCPSGWHVPSHAEWKKLTDTILAPATAGTKLKANSANWRTNTGTDDYGFAVQPGGYSFGGGGNFDIGELGAFWSATETYKKGAWNRGFNSEDSVVSSYGYYYKTNSYSLRCLRD